MTYQEAKALAQARADLTGTDQRVFRIAFGLFSHAGLPRRENRYGRDLEGEVVYPTDLAKCRPGHGPCAGRR